MLFGLKSELFSESWKSPYWENNYMHHMCHAILQLSDNWSVLAQQPLKICFNDLYVTIESMVPFIILWNLAKYISWTSCSDVVRLNNLVIRLTSRRSKHQCCSIYPKSSCRCSSLAYGAITLFSFLLFCVSLIPFLSSSSESPLLFHQNLHW